MTVPRLLDRLASSLAAAVAGSAEVDGARPAVSDDLPHVTLSFEHLASSLTGIGQRPAPSRTGSLAVQSTVDLADPTVTFLDGSSAMLLSVDRVMLHLPFGPAVGFDGASKQFLEPLDITVELDGAPIAVVGTPPTGGEVRVDATTGQLRSGTPLPATGTLSLAYFIGEWEVSIDRFQGDLVIDAFAADAAGVESLCELVATGLVPANAGGLTELKSIDPRSYGPIEPPDATAANARRRRLVYVFDAEIEDARLEGGGGPIRTVEVDSAFGTEAFDIPVSLAP